MHIPMCYECKKKIKVLIIDDSALMRQLLTAIFHEDPELHVVGTAANPLLARELKKCMFVSCNEFFSQKL